MMSIDKQIPQVNPPEISSLNTIPLEILLEICEYLPPETTLGLIPQINKHFYKAIDEYLTDEKTIRSLFKKLFEINFFVVYERLNYEKINNWYEIFRKTYHDQYKGFSKHLRGAFSCLKIKDVEGFKQTLSLMKIEELVQPDKDNTTLLDLLITTECQEARDVFHKWISNARKKNMKGAKAIPLIFWDVLCKKPLSDIKIHLKKYKKDNPRIKCPQKPYKLLTNYTILHHAAKCKYANLLKYLVDEKNVDPDMHLVSNDPTTNPIYLAAIYGDLDTLKYLVDEKNVDFTFFNDQFYLYRIAENNHIHILSYLLDEKKLPIKSDEFSQLLKTSIDKSSTALISYLIQFSVKFPDYEMIINGALCYASKKDYLNIVKLLIDHGKDADFNAPYTDDMRTLKYAIDNSIFMSSTALHIAAYENNIDVVEYIIHSNKIDIEMLDNQGRSPIYIALTCGHVELIEYFFLHEKCKPHLLKIMPLHQAIRELGQTTQNHHQTIKNIESKKISKTYSKVKKTNEIKNKNQRFDKTHAAMMKVIQFLIAHNIQIDITDNFGDTPLFLAAFYGLFEVAKALIEKQKEKDKFNINTADAVGNTLLQFAVNYDNGFVEYLVSKGVNVNTVNQFGDTPLHGAVIAGHTNVVQCLLEHGAKIDTAASDDGYTPFHLAAQLGYLEILKLFIPKKEKSDGVINSATKQGITPLYLAVQSNQLKVVKFLIMQDKTLLNHTDSAGNTLLHIASAISKDNIKMVTYLCQKKLDINAKNNRGETPLYLAALQNNLSVARYLIEKGAELNITTNDGFSPLDAAAEFGFINLFIYFMQKQPNIDTHKAFVLAIEFGHSNIVRHLIENNLITPDFSHIELALKCEHDYIAQYLVNYIFNNDETFLVTAIKENNFSLVQLCLNAGADINYPSKGYTPLGTAIVVNNLIIIDFLLAFQTCDVNMPYSIQGVWTTPLLAAAATGNTELISLLNSRGAKLFQFSDQLSISAGNIRDILIIIELLKCALPNDYSCHIFFLKNAITRKDLKAFKQLLPLIPTFIQNGLQKTFYSMVLESKDDQFISAFLSQQSPQNLYTYFFLAAENNHLDIIKRLLSHNINPNYVDHQKEKTALIVAIESGSDDVAAYLLSFPLIDLNIMVKGPHQTALAMALFHRNLPISKLILNHPSIDPTRYCGSGSIPLILAVQINDVDIVKAIVDKIVDKNVNVNVTTDGDIETPLKIALLNNNPDIVKYLLDKGANPNISYFGMTPLEIALNAGNVPMIQLLLDKGAKLKPSSTLDKTIETIANNPEILNLLAKKGFVLQEFIVDKNRLTPLALTFIRVMAKTGSTSILNFLFTIGFKADSLFHLTNDATFATTLLLCTIIFSTDCLAIVRTLLLNNADVNLADSDGRTPLLMAVEKKNTSLVAFLLEQGANSHLANNKNITPLAKAKELGLDKVIPLLEKALLKNPQKKPLEENNKSAAHLTDMFLHRPSTPPVIQTTTTSTISNITTTSANAQPDETNIQTHNDIPSTENRPGQ